MTFARTETTVLNHPKFMGLDPAAIGLWTMGNAYCWDQLTDGFISDEQLPRLMTWLSLKRLRVLANVLANATAHGRYKQGLWERVEGGFRVHDWLDHNPTKEKVLADRKAARDRMKSLRSESRSHERTREHLDGSTARSAARSPVRSRQEVEVEVYPPHSPPGTSTQSKARSTVQDPRSPTGAFPPECFRTDCPDKSWHGRCVDQAYAAAHPGAYPVQLSTGLPKQCPAHRPAGPTTAVATTWP
jgi:hypothetical protein